MHTHAYYMDMAIEQALEAQEQGEVPVGAVAVFDNKVIARAHNSSISLRDPTAHAEILALRQAGLALGNYRLTGLSLYVTIEPCIMCAGAMLHARIRQLVFGARDEKAGALTLFDLFHNTRMNHRIEAVAGVRESATAILLQEFFKKKRRS
jgi:tRNA(adenine34) deaminase